MLNTQMNKTLAVDQTEKNSVCNRRKKKNIPRGGFEPPT